MSDISIAVIAIRAVFMIALVLSLVPLLIYLERKVSAFIQDRSGPNRTTIFNIRAGGLFQSIADVIKLVFKEEFISSHIKERLYYHIAPMILFLTSMLGIAIVPFADNLNIDGNSYMMQALPVNLGILWYLGFASLSVYGIILAGYASENKYSILGSIRASSQAIGYEIPLSLSILSMLITYQSFNLNDFVVYQSGTLFGFLPKWGMLVQPLAFIIFIIAIFAETNRTPFDLPEGESEIVGGYHTEYSAMKFALFFMAEYVAMCSASALIITIFFGGYNLPFVSTQMLIDNIEYVFFIGMLAVPLFSLLVILWVWKNNRINAPIVRKKENTIISIVISLIAIGVTYFLASLYFSSLDEVGRSVSAVFVQAIVFTIKTLIGLLFFILVRWTLPRFRYDQIHKLCWEKLIPLSMLNIFISAIIVIL